MKRVLTITAIVTLILTGCSKDPISNFAYTPANPLAGEEVFFENLSVDAEAFEWRFGDGTATSEISPSHIFTDGGTYTVELSALGHRRGIDISTATITVKALDPTADFSIYTDLPDANGDPVPYETDVVFVGEYVEFFNTSVEALTYNWEFGDGYESELESPVYSYDDPGTYTVTLIAYGTNNNVDTYSKTIQVVEGINSVLRITVLEYYELFPVDGASVILFDTYSDWETHDIDFSVADEVFTSPLGKCVIQGLNYQTYFVDVFGKYHDNWQIGTEDIGFVETQALEPGYIHDFIAYVDYYPDGKKMTLTRIGRKKLADEQISSKKASEMRTVKDNKFSKAR